MCELRLELFFSKPSIDPLSPSSLLCHPRAPLSHPQAPYCHPRAPFVTPAQAGVQDDIEEICRVERFLQSNKNEKQR